MVSVYLIPSHASKKICYNFSYVLYLARILLVRWDGLREPACGDQGGGATYTYDNNGNVTAIGSLDYTWDWRNRLASAERSGGGHHQLRVRSYRPEDLPGDREATTSYPNRYYNVASSSLSATTTKHIFSPDGTLLATVVGASTTATTTYLHSDHLGGTNVTTNSTGK